MNEDAAAQALGAAGYPVHSHDGVWWQQVRPGFCKPVNPVRTVPIGSAAPKYSRSFLGFSHPTTRTATANHSWDVMALEEGALRTFGIEGLKPRKRSTIRKALRTLSIDHIANIDDHLDDLNAICVSAAERTGHGLPPEHYLNRRNAWERFMRNEFQIPGREWWGVFHETRLIAYIYAFLIEGTMHISAAKSHSDGLRLKPNDAVVFSFLEYCRDRPDCDEVIFGDASPDTPSLNRFKEHFGFRKCAIPIHRKIRFPANAAVMFTRRGR